MKHLFRNRAFRLPMLLVLVVFACVGMTPDSAHASINITIGANATEGDPTDGLDFVGGGSSILEPDKHLESDQFTPNPIIVFPIGFGVYVTPGFHPEQFFDEFQLGLQFTIPADIYRRDNK